MKATTGIFFQKRKYREHKCSTTPRNIEFKLTYEEWWDIWEKSGHWEERGNKKGQYVMSRKGDEGPYEVGNVFIQTTEKNISQAQRDVVGWKDSDETRLKKSLAHKGVPKPPITELHRLNLSLSHLGNVPSNKDIADIIVKCPHCPKEGGRSIMKRWHFDKCKYKV